MVEEIFKSKGQKNTAVIIFCCYIALLIFIVLFKFGNIIHMRSVNLIPYTRTDFENEYFKSWIIKELAYNVLVFVPLGGYVAIFQPKYYYFIPSLVSLLFEVLQFIFAIGTSDITDLINNTVGGLIGIGLWFLIKKYFPGKGITIVNTVGICSLLVAACLIGIVVVI